jgi:hypothetical protein
MEFILYRQSDLKAHEPIRSLQNSQLVVDTVRAVFEGLDDSDDVLRLNIQDGERVLLYTPYAVCIIDRENVTLLEKDDVRKIYLALFK